MHSNPKRKAITMKLGDMFPSKYLKAADLNGKDLTLTILGCEMETIGEDKESKPVLDFADEAKSLVLNKTNATIISRLHGSDTAQWGGKRITLYATKVQFKGDMQDAIRIREQAPSPAGSTDKKDEIGF